MRFAPTPQGTRALAFSETGGYRLKFPRAVGCEAMIVNTSGGVVGGDQLMLDAACEAGATASFSTQSADKIYRAQRDPARMVVNLDLGERAHLAWLPQETILFNGARIERRLNVTMAHDACLTLCEAVICGRSAMGEILQTGCFVDRWTIRRDGRLAYADAVRLEGDISERMMRRASGAGAQAFATILRVSPDAEHHVDAIRMILAECSLNWGVSAWDGLLAVRFCARDAALLRPWLVVVLKQFEDCAIPRIWSW